ncbi:NERD domain-containing protein [Lentibacillus saliphilus]|uniref:NERD domain-containing protein n=1 Tax=Lentibacillus saliphilus TaxID=2737028 RepID=UPI001C303833|nr:NERD domain-containing protein [Lentibacillus saliphilus]
MAQLVKLRDYVSRYEWNIFRYPSQYIRMKQDNWNKLHRQWENMDQHTNDDIATQENLSKVRKWLSFIKKEAKPNAEEDIDHHDIPQSELQLKQLFLDQLLPFQFKWATSTVTDVSFVEPSIYRDETLKYFLQRFPDTYLLMYYPVFHIKHAPVDGDIILISPLEIEIIHLLETDAQTTIRTNEGRTWTLERHDQKTTILNPEIALKRTEAIVKRLLAEHNLKMTINRTVLSRTNKIVTDHYLYQTNIVDKQNHDRWIQQKRQLVSPLKSLQLKATGLLLKHCLTSSVKRPEWEEDETDFQMGEEDL